MINFLAIPKGLLLGLGSALPLGPIALLVINNTLKNGRREGFMAGLGGSLADTTYATISLLTISIFYDFIRNNENTIAIIGGSLIILIGVISTLLPDKPQKEHSAAINHTLKANKYPIGKVLQGFLLAISNPGALFWSITIIALLRIGTIAEDLTTTVMTLLCVFAGSATYWLMATKVISKFGKRIKVENFKRINKYAGIGIAIFGLLLIIKGITKVL